MSELYEQYAIIALRSVLWVGTLIGFFFLSKAKGSFWRKLSAFVIPVLLFALADEIAKESLPLDNSYIHLLMFIASLALLGPLFAHVASRNLWLFFVIVISGLLSFLLFYHGRLYSTDIIAIVHNGSGEREAFIKTLMERQNERWYEWVFPLVAVAMYFVARGLQRSVGRPVAVSVLICLPCIYGLLTARPIVQFPVEAWVAAETAASELEQLKRDIDSVRFEDTEDSGSRHQGPLNIVLYIGDGSSRHHWSLYGYGFNTTPKLKRLQEELLVFTDAASPFSHSAQALAEILSDVNKHRDDKPAPRFSLVEVADSAGFQVSWISNREALTVSDSVSSMHATLADQQWRIKPDENGAIYEHDLIDYYRNNQTALESDQFNLTILHGRSIQPDYCSDLPPAWRSGQQGLIYDARYAGAGDTSPEILRCYDLNMRYQDDLIAQLAESTLSSEQATVFIYTSAHGEDPARGGGHDWTQHSFRHTDVPLIVAFSEQAKSQLATQYQAAQDNRTKRVEISDLFYWISDLVGSNNESVIRAGQSIFDSHFDAAARDILVSNEGYISLDTPRHDPSFGVDLSDNYEKYRRVLRHQPLEQRQRMCATDTHSMLKMQEASALFNCIQLTVWFDSQQQRLLVMDPPGVGTTLPLNQLLSFSSRTPTQLWLSLQNLNAGNIADIRKVLQGITQAWPETQWYIESAASIELANWSRTAAGDSWQWVWPLPNSLVACRAAADNCAAQASDIASRLSASGINTISFDIDLIGWALNAPAFESLNMIMHDPKEVALDDGKLETRQANWHRRLKHISTPYRSWFDH